jgi:hypothetical protein
MDQISVREAPAQQPDDHSHPYTTLGPGVIRLVDILPGQFDDSVRVRIHKANLAQNPQFTALSYVWNPQDRTIDKSLKSESISVEGHSSFFLTVGNNLAAAIRHIRFHQEARTFWIDAICINQSSDLEKNRQVALMGTIYSSADEVIIWLGPAKNNSSFVMESVATGRVRVEDGEKFLDSLELLLLRDWFGRAWVVQELVLASRNPGILCGHNSLDWSVFATAVQVLRSRIHDKIWPGNVFDVTITLDYSDNLTQSGIPSGDTEVDLEEIVDIVHKAAEHGGSGMSDLPMAVAALAVRVTGLAEMREAGKIASFSKRLQSTIYMRATDPRDRVFALIGISSFSGQRLSADTRPQRMMWLLQ